MAAESSSRGELTQLVTYHVFSHKHAEVLLAIVDHKRQADEFRYNRASSSPSRDWLTTPARIARLDHLLIKARIDKWTLFS